MTVIGSPLGYRADAKRKFVPISILSSYLMSGCAMSKIASSTSKQQLERNVAFGGGDKYSIKIEQQSMAFFLFFNNHLLMLMRPNPWLGSRLLTKLITAETKLLLPGVFNTRLCGPRLGNYYQE